MRVSVALFLFIVFLPVLFTGCSSPTDTTHTCQAAFCADDGNAGERSAPAGYSYLTSEYKQCRVSSPIQKDLTAIYVMYQVNGADYCQKNNYYQESQNDTCVWRWSTQTSHYYSTYWNGPYNNLTATTHSRNEAQQCTNILWNGVRCTKTRTIIKTESHTWGGNACIKCGYPR